MLQAHDKSTFLRRLYPTTKLWLCLAIAVSVLLFANTWYSLALLVLGIALIVYERFYLEFKVIAVALCLMFISMFLINGTLNPINDFTQPPVFTIPFIGWKFYREGLLHALSVYRRVAPLMSCLFLLFRTINTTDLGIALNQGGLPYRASFVFINVFQIVPVLNKEMHQIMDAQRARGLQTDGNLIQRFKASIPIIIPVVSNSIMKVQDQAVALSTKGFNCPAAKTIYRDLHKEPVDRALMVFSILLCLAAVAYRVWRIFAGA